MLNHLLALDRAIFYLINGAHNSAIDSLMTAVTRLGDSTTLLPLAVLLFLITWKKHLWPLFLLIGVTLLLSDGIAHQLKPIVGRIRPSHTLPNVHALAGYTGGLYSFPSNHSSNAFALAFVLGSFWRRRRAWLLALAGLIGYSRIYLGVHYPGDVLGGALLGSFVAWLAVLSYGHLARRLGKEGSWHKTTAL